MNCQWKICNGLIWDYGETAFPRLRCLSCGRSSDIEWEEKKAILQALAGERQRHVYGSGQELNKIYALMRKAKVMA